MILIGHPQGEDILCYASSFINVAHHCALQRVKFGEGLDAEISRQGASRVFVGPDRLGKGKLLFEIPLVVHVIIVNILLVECINLGYL